MIRSLHTAEKAMQMDQVRIDALANNLANSTSTGFRQILTRVTETQEGGGQGRLPSLAQTSQSWPQLPSLNMSHALDPRHGPVEATGRQTDLAVMGKGYFVVATENGDRFTRNGSFVLNEQRQLTTVTGQLVQGDGGPITLAGTSFSIEQDGSVVVDGNIAGRIRLVDFADATRLEHEGDNLLKAPPGSTPSPSLRLRSPFRRDTSKAATSTPSIPSWR